MVYTINNTVNAIMYFLKGFKILYVVLLQQRNFAGLLYQTKMYSHTSHNLLILDCTIECHACFCIAFSHFLFLRNFE